MKSLNKTEIADDCKALECMQFLMEYTHARTCGECTLKSGYRCPCKRGERCPALWECD